MIYIVAHIALALSLFRMVNWIGEHATDFGYGSTTLFEEPNESLALNFFIRALAPAVFIVLLSAAAVALEHAELRIGIHWVAIFYYLLRFIYIFGMNIHQLISWPRFILHTSLGIAAALFAYYSLILPNRSLLPDLETIGNELWLAIFAFLYAAGNKVTLVGGPGNRRRNAFIKKNFTQASNLYGKLISDKSTDDKLELLAYAVLIYENYSRPPSVRALERLCFWRRQRTTGIMQVAASKPLSDQESVELGVCKLNSSWLRHWDESPYMRTRATISDYNKDDDYISRVLEVMEILAVRVAPQFREAYEEMTGWE